MEENNNTGDLNNTIQDSKSAYNDFSYTILRYNNYNLIVIIFFKFT